MISKTCILPIIILAFFINNCCQKKLSEKEQTSLELEKAISLGPECIQTYIECARICCDQDNINQARIYLRTALKKGIPQSLEHAFTISNLLLATGNLIGFLHILEYLHILYPQNPSIMHNLAIAYKIVGNHDKAVEILRKILSLLPEREESHFLLGHTLLQKGDFEHGWAQHNRYLLRTHRYTKKLKEWIDQGTLKGKRVLLLQEGGLGDTIQWIRCAKILKEQGATITACIPQTLMPLLSQCSYIDKFVATKKTIPNYAQYDAAATIMSLPAILNLNESQMALSIPYIFPDASLSDYWGKKLSTNQNFKIGLCWQADIENDKKRVPFARRSIPIEQLFILGSIPKISFYSLQINVTQQDIHKAKQYLPIVEFCDDFDKIHGAFMDSASIIEHMNLVITVDSSIAHLTGALGKPVWLILPYYPDWRWVTNSQDSPWYPSMRIFRQHSPCDWSSVAYDLYKALLSRVDSN